MEGIGRAHHARGRREFRRHNAIFSFAAHLMAPGKSFDGSSLVLRSSLATPETGRRTSISSIALATVPLPGASSARATHPLLGS